MSGQIQCYLIRKICNLQQYRSRIILIDYIIKTIAIDWGKQKPSRGRCKFVNGFVGIEPDERFIKADINSQDGWSNECYRAHMHQRNRRICIVFTEHVHTHVLIAVALHLARFSLFHHVFLRRTSTGAGLRCLIDVVTGRTRWTRNTVLSIHLVKVIRTEQGIIDASQPIVQ